MAQFPSPSGFRTSTVAQVVSQMVLIVAVCVGLSSTWLYHLVSSHPPQACTASAWMALEEYAVARSLTWRATDPSGPPTYTSD